MDHYLAKPMDVDKLEEFLKNHISMPAKTTILNVINDNNYKELIEEYREYYPKTVHKIREAFNCNDFDECKRLLHGLKGSAANLRLTNISQISYKAEVCLLNNDENSVNDLISRLESISI